MNTCLACSKLFSPYKSKPNQSYCSKSCRQEYKNKWGREHPEGKQQWVLNNPEKRAEASRKYTQANKHYYAEYTTLRSRGVKTAKPKWLSEWDLFISSEIYHLARLRGLEVDHIIPIKHDKVCGLHVPWNLQLLSRSENAKKSNKFDEDLCVEIIGEK